uniref:FLYWCH-type domain-containing protein n=1 Tax=Panagrellus redivivus TaxID=6233 RepID=A0A7E4V663_PANRE
MTTTPTPRIPETENDKIFTDGSKADAYLRENMLKRQDDPTKTKYGFRQPFYCPLKSRKDVRCRFAATGYLTPGRIRIVTRRKHCHKVVPIPVENAKPHRLAEDQQQSDESDANDMNASSSVPVKTESTNDDIDFEHGHDITQDADHLDSTSNTFSPSSPPSISSVLTASPENDTTFASFVAHHSGTLMKIAVDMKLVFNFDGSQAATFSFHQQSSNVKLIFTALQNHVKVENFNAGGTVSSQLWQKSDSLQFLAEVCANTFNMSSARRSMPPTEGDVRVFLTEAQAQSFLRENMLNPIDKPRKTGYGYSRGYFCKYKARRHVKCRFAATGYAKNGEYRVETRYKHNHKMIAVASHEKVEVLLDSRGEESIAGDSDEEMPTSSNSRPVSAVSTNDFRRFTRSASRGPAASAPGKSIPRLSGPKPSSTTPNSPGASFTNNSSSLQPREKVKVVLDTSSEESSTDDSDEEMPTSSNSRPTMAVSTNDTQRLTRSASRGPSASAPRSAPTCRSPSKSACTTPNSSPDKSIANYSDEEVSTSSNIRPASRVPTNNPMRVTRSASRGPAVPASRSATTRRSAPKPANTTPKSPDEIITFDGDKEMPASSNGGPITRVSITHALRFKRRACSGPTATPTRITILRQAATKPSDNTRISSDESSTSDSDEERPTRSNTQPTAAARDNNTKHVRKGASRGPAVPPSRNQLARRIDPKPSDTAPNFKAFLKKYGGALVKIALELELVFTIDGITNESIVFTHNNRCADLEFTALDNNEAEVKTTKYVEVGPTFYKVNKKTKYDRSDDAKFLATIRTICAKFSNVLF